MAKNQTSPIADNLMAIPPWERADTEGDRPWQAFQMYRDMGPGRSITQVAQELNKSRSLIGRWNGRWRWRERVVPYDYETDRQQRMVLNEATQKMVERHASVAQSSLEILRAVPLAFSAKLNAAKSQADLIAELAELPMVELVELMSRVSMGVERLTRTERLARGEPTEITQAEEFVATVTLEETYTDDDTDDPTALAQFLAGLHSAGLFDPPAATGDPPAADSEDS